MARERHFSIATPIKVGGRILFGPRPGKYDLANSQHEPKIRWGSLEHIGRLVIGFGFLAYGIDLLWQNNINAGIWTSIASIAPITFHSARASKFGKMIKDIAENNF